MSRKNKKQLKKRGTVSQQSTPWITEEAGGFLTLSLAVILLLSLVSYSLSPFSKNLLGLMGHTVGWSLHALFGLGSYLIAIYVGWIGWRLLFGKSISRLWLKHIYVGVAVISTCMLLSLVEAEAPEATQKIRELFYSGLVEKKMRIHIGGAPFYYLYSDLPAFNLKHLINSVGVAFVFTSLLVTSLIFLFKIRLAALSTWFSGWSFRNDEENISFTEEPPRVKEKAAAAVFPPSPQESRAQESDFLRFVKLRIPTDAMQEATQKNSTPSPSLDLLAIRPDQNLTERPSLSRKEHKEEKEGRDAFKQLATSPPAPIKEASEKVRKKEAAIIAQGVYNGDFTNYKLPALSLLTNAKKVDQSSIKKDLKRQAEVLEETLLSFGIEAKVGQINCGPTITSFEVHPAIGVKVQKIKSLEGDIALNMEAKSIRIIAPIPGKAAVGIEVPNPQPQEVAFKDMLVAYQQRGQKFHIPILLGQAVNGDFVMNDLTKMPHCIIAGATGSGKSVCINTIIMSILLNAKPDQVKLVMVDPKKVELTPYSALPHMLAPVITEARGAAAALNWMVREMENRYEILKLVGVRNIESFNKRTINTEAESQMGREIPSFMPFIVGIIDELADLMMVASQDIETPIARIAQMARAVGIHLILATQRPSREVITGLIKANFPTRISFKVASRVNSQIVLDEIGAESLLGNGDMLFLPPGSSHLIRAQGAFIRDEDIQGVIQAICEQAPPNYVIQSFDHMTESEGGGEFVDDSCEFDTMYDQAKEVVLSTGNASTTFLQRKLKIGYARAASLMDQLEKKGIVGPIDGSRPRKVFGRKESAQEEALVAEE